MKTQTETINRNSFSFKLGFAVGLVKSIPPEICRRIWHLLAYVWTCFKFKRKVNSIDQKKELN